MLPYMAKNFEDVIKDLEIGKLSWIIQVGPEIGVFIRRKATLWKQREIGSYSAGFEDEEGGQETRNVRASRR